MTIYLDSSAVLKRYVDEDDSDRFNAFLAGDERWLTSRITWLEVWRNLGRRLATPHVTEARAAFSADWSRMLVVEIDTVLVEQAGQIADLTAARSLDALHLAALQRSGPGDIPLVTADLRQAQAARTLGWTVIGA